MCESKLYIENIQLFLEHSLVLKFDRHAYEFVCGLASSITHIFQKCTLFLSLFTFLSLVHYFKQ